MTMTTEEYYQMTAKELGLKTRMSAWPEKSGQLCYYPNPDNLLYYIPWHPDEDANQMLMVWDQLKEQGCKIEIHINKVLYTCEIVQPNMIFFYADGKSLFTATQKAFEAYIGEKNHV